MYSVPHKPIPESDIREEHMRILEWAVENSILFDIRNAEVYSALDYLQAYSSRSWGFTVYREGLEYGKPEALKQGLRLIKGYLGRD